MIYLVDGSNTVVLTLDEKATSLTYDVLFEFTNELTKKITYFTASDSSAYARYNEFTFTVNQGENLYNAQIELEEGQYKYVVYQMPVSSPPSLDVDDAVKVLERGRARVFSELEFDSFNANDSNETPQFE